MRTDLGSPLPGAHDKIAALRQRHAQVTASIDYHQGRLAEQTVQLGQLNRSRDVGDDGPAAVPEPAPVEAAMTDEDVRRAEDEMQQLERKKRALEDRVHAMSRDLSGLR